MPGALDRAGVHRLAAITALGYASGLPLALSGGTLQAWATDAGAELATIGWLTLVAQAYTFKFLWAPLADRYHAPFLGRRRGWIVLCQGLLAVLVLLYALQPVRADAVVLVAAIAVGIAFASATQDILIDAYRTDLLPARERGLGASLTVGGYRLAMITSGAFALILADQYGWPAALGLLAALFLPLMLLTAWAPEPHYEERPPRGLDQVLLEPFRRYFRRPAAWAWLALIVLYKFGDALAQALSTTFLLRELAFSKTEVGAINKGIGLLASIGGALLGGVLMLRLSLYRALLVFGLLQALTNLGYYLLATMAKSLELLSAVIVAENLCGGMGTAALTALLMSLTEKRYSATQYALLSALAAIGRVYVGPLAALLVARFGWADFFLQTLLLAAPGLLLLVLMRRRFTDLESDLPAEAAAAPRR